jgi:asparagine synthase (glutamine-hydrolysing)
MCGLIAFSGKTHQGSVEPALRLGMAQMRSRGPDGQGVWSDAGIILGHLRLAILDLDPRAMQPMRSPCGRYMLVFNGEIYNFKQLKQQLQKDSVVFATESDSEVILALYAKHGAAMLPMLRGMFALLIWDTQRQCGFAARDPYGIKPLYYAETGEGLWLASQVKALMATGRIAETLDAEAQAGFWLLGSVPEPNTWYAGIKALPAGHYVYFADGTLQETPKPYWDIAEEFRSPMGHVPATQNIYHEVRAALQESVAAHLVADVPVAVLLSGGIDSSALAGLMREAGASDLHGVTVAFSEFAGKPEDEAPLAAVVAKHYGIKHHIRWVCKDEFLDELPKILAAMDQPSIDGVNTYFASKAVAELGLKVVVSGVGGDELFQGYSSFATVPRLYQYMRLARTIPGAYALAQAVFRRYAWRTGKLRWQHVPEYAQNLAGAWFLSRGVYAVPELPAALSAATAGFQPGPWIGARMGPTAENPRLAISQLESCFYLRNQLLRDSDWASMAHSVELRTPLVDAHLLRRLRPYLPQFQQYPGKALLAQSVRPLLPERVASRAKTGFGIPIASWLADQDAPAAMHFDSKSWARHVASMFSGIAQ